MLTCDLKVEPREIVFPPTYISTTSKNIFEIWNESDHIINYEVRKFSSTEEEINTMMTYDIDDPESRREYISSLLFISDDFSIEPIKGEIWPKRKQNILIVFHPSTYGEIHTTAYITDVQTNERTAFPIHGVCLPPAAKFPVSLLNIGHVMLDSVQEYQIMLKNVGEAPVNFSFIENETNPKIDFNPKKGMIPVGSSYPISIMLYATKVGQFTFDYKYCIEGAKEEDYPMLTVYGRVLGPTYKIDVKNIDFSLVSCGFLYSKKVNIQNTSEIPLEFESMIQSDDGYNSRELSVSPANGTVLPKTTMTVSIEFIPSQIKRYSANISFIAPNDGECLFTIPMTAISRSPQIVADQTDIDLGKIFVNYPNVTNVVLTNDKKIPGKYDILTANEDEYGCSFQLPKETGIVKEQSSTEVPFIITATQLGPMTATRLIRIYGSDEPPILVSFHFTCIGPLVNFSSDAIKFGKISVLEDHTQTLTLTNQSSISCDYTLSLDSLTEVFRIDKEQGTIEPNSSVTVTVIANLDDSSSFSTFLTATFSYNVPVKIPISASGAGHCFVSSIDMETIDLESAFAGQTVTKEFVIENRGRLPKELKWTFGKAQVEGKGQLKAEITPSSVTIQPHSAQNFVISLECKVPSKFTIPLMCTLPASKSSRGELFKPVVKCEFAKVLINIRDKQMNFEYFHNSELEEQYSSMTKAVTPSLNLLGVLEKENTIENTSQLPLIVQLAVTQPFSVSHESFELQPGATFPFKVFFDTSFKRDFITEFVDRRLSVTFEGNPQKYNIPLHGEVNFPNVQLSETAIDYGSVLISSENVHKIEVQNISKLPATFSWQIYAGDNPTTKNAFDVYPLRGVIPPGQSETIHFTFYGLSTETGKGLTFTAQSVCHIDGGPDYPLSLKGKTSAIEYNITPQKIDFGVIKYTDYSTSQIAIENHGESMVKFKIQIPQKKEFEELIVEPMSGTVKPNDRLYLNVTVWPGAPKKYKDHIVVSTGFFDDIIVNIFADCQYNRLLFIMDGEEMNPDAETERNECIEQSIQLCNNSKNKHKKYHEQRAKAKISPMQPESKPLSVFDVNFGTFIVSDVITKEITITNESPFAANFEIRAKCLEGTGFSISPLSCVGIPPGDSVPVTVLFDPSKMADYKSGSVEHLVSIMVTDELYYSFNIKATLQAPTLIFSTKKIEFPPTIVGQTMIISFQVQNLNTVPCFYEIQEGNTTNTTKMIGKGNNIFDVTPHTGKINPQSYQNIDVSFSPKGSKDYQVQFPFVIRYNHEVQNINVFGSGSVLKLALFPPVANFEQVSPYSGVQSMQILLSNPTKYPIEVFSRQFDLNLVTDRAARLLTGTPLSRTRAEKTKEVKASISDLVSYSENSAKVCIIITGPPKSGSTMVANKLSDEYDNTPILRLIDIWKDLPADASFEQMSELFTDAVKDKSNIILDGLDCFDDANEIHQFILHASKQKGAHDEIMKNIFTEAKHQNTLHIETEVKAILHVLKGWHVFLVGLVADDDSLTSRKDLILLREQEMEPLKQQQEMDRIMNMTDEEYNNLSESEQEEVDIKRKTYRNTLLYRTFTPETDKPAGKQSSRSKKPALKRSKSIIPDDPFKFEIMKFYYTFGIIAKEIMNGDNGIIVSDISMFNPNRSPEFKIHYQKNVLIVDANNSIDDSFQTILACIPSLDAIKAHAFQSFLPEPRLIVPNTDAFPISDEPPEMFCIETESNDDSEFSNCTPRWSIQPGESVPIIVNFTGQKIGTYEDKLTFSISGCKTEIFVLPTKARISYPEINRDFRTLFGDSVQNPTSKTQLVYVNSLKSFFFGYLILAKEKSMKNSSFKQSKEITLTNTSVFPVNINCIFSEQQPKGVWLCEPSQLVIPPNESATITVSFIPMVIGTHNNILTLFIKDNPEPLNLPLCGVCCVPHLEFSTDTLDFEKIITNQTAQHTITIKNNEKIPAYWRFKGGNTLGPCFEINPIEGVLPPNGTQQVVVSFSSKKQLTFKKPIQIEVMDKTKLRTFDTYTVNVLAEAFDVNFDIDFEDSSHSLNFGMMKAGTQKSSKIVMKTHGKYPIMFQIKFSSKNISQLFNVFPLNGGVQPNDKGTVVQFTYCANHKTKYNHAKGLSVSISDTLTGTEIANVPLPFTAQTVFSQWTLSPETELDFGTLPVGIKQTKEITITNTGFYEFSYLVSSSQPIEELKKTSTSKKSVKMPKGAPTSKRPSLNKLPLTLTIGEAQFVQQSLVVKPNESSTIKVDVTAVNGQKLNIPVLIKVSDCDPQLNDGVPFTVLGTPIVPSIVTDDIENIFKQTNICSRSELVLADTNSFLLDQKILHFAPIASNSKSTITINLINKQSVAAEVTGLVKTSKQEQNIWSISPKTVTVEPNSSAPVDITFQPKDVGTYKAQFIATVLGSTSMFQINMEGTSSIPSVSVQTMTDLQMSFDECQSFDRLLVSFKKEKTVIITNTSSLPSTVLLQASPNPDFVLPSLDSSDGRLVMPGESFSVPVVFAPQKARKTQFDLQIRVKDNQNFLKTITFTGEGFCEAVYFEGNSTGECDLLFKDTIVGTVQKLDFTLHNVSQDCFRFQFNPVQDFSFMPRTGHIHGNSRKRITCTFHSDKPVKYVGTRVTCSRVKIDLDQNAPDWDDTHSTIKYVRKSELNPNMSSITPPARDTSKRVRKIPTKSVVPDSSPDEIVKVLEVEPEPPYTVSKDKFKDIVLLISAAAGSIKFDVSDTQLEFPSTFMYEKKYHTFSMTNTGDVAFDFNWRPGRFSQVGRKNSHKYACPFTIDPQCGNLKPRDKMDFRATFSPLTDSEFAGEMICEIPGSKDFPIINVSGISTRPIIHVNMELSDYLSSKRRGPEFKDTLPDEIRVLEIVSKEKGKSVVKMLEMINTTDTPYEINWSCKYDHSEGSIVCKTHTAFISSGKSFFSAFIYTPKSSKTVEALWTFYVPSHNISADILVVGRVSNIQ